MKNITQQEKDMIVYAAKEICNCIDSPFCDYFEIVRDNHKATISVKFKIGQRVLVGKKNGILEGVDIFSQPARCVVRFDRDPDCTVVCMKDVVIMGRDD